MRIGHAEQIRLFGTLKMNFDLEAFHKRCHLFTYLWISFFVKYSYFHPFQAPLKANGRVSISVATYNVWNIMFNWDVRKYRISKMLKDIDADIVAFQEIRSSDLPTSGTSQLDELQELLPQLKYKIFHGANAVLPVKGVYKLLWSFEGVGVLSKYPIHNVHVQNLTNTGSRDTNLRFVVHAVVEVQDVMLHVSVVHYTYDQLYQCCNSLQLINYLKNVPVERKIIMGDFNAYEDASQATMLLGRHDHLEASSIHRCCRRKDIQGKFPVNSGNFVDACHTNNVSSKALYTFSNMPDPGLQSRPDRIYVSDNINIQDCGVTGTGEVYQKYFYGHVLIHRFKAVFMTLWDVLHGYTGRPCPHDCGPHASCRCGVCVSGSDKLCCDIPNCEECNYVTALFLVPTALFAFVVIITVLYALLKVFTAMNHKHSKSMIPQCDWFCLLDEVMFVPSSGQRHTHWKPGKHRKKPSLLSSMPPMMMLVLSLLLASIFCQLFILIFGILLDDVFAIIPEELFPSDHLLLFTQIKL